MKPSFLAGPALTLALALLVPVFFVFSQNWFMVEPEAMLWSAGIAFFAACILFLTASLVGRCWRKVSPNVPRPLRLLALLLFCLVLVIMVCFFLQGPLRAAIPESRWLRTLVFYALPCIGLFLWVRRFAFLHINIFLLIFCSFSIVNLSLPLLKEEPSPLVEHPLATYAMKERPNIYLFFQESLHSLDILRDAYGMDTSELEAYLAKAGFTDYGKIYANSPSTLPSFADTFSFRSSRAFARGNGDAAVGIRYMLGGAESNTLLRVLKTNGYTTAFLVGDTGYFGTVKGKLLDSSDGICVLPQENSISGVISCVSMLNTRFHRRLFGLMRRLAGSDTAGDVIYHGPLEERVSQAVAAHMRPEAPLFLTFKGGAKHTPSNGGYTWRQLAEWVQGGEYQRAVEKGSQELQRICDNIIANDPGAMIIILGDHGPRRLQDIEKGAASVDELKAQLQKTDFSFPDFCDDRHAVFLAIRLPYGRPGDISYGLPLSHVNLFRHVLAYLNDDQSILADREPSESYWKGSVIVKEGKPVAE